MTVKTHRKRTLASAITYRITSSILLAVISFTVTGQWIESLTVTASFAILATVLFYFNDRAWERTDWGRQAEGPAVADGSSLSTQTSLGVSSPWSNVIRVQHQLLEEAS